MLCVPPVSIRKNAIRPPLAAVFAIILLSSFLSGCLNTIFEPEPKGNDTRARTFSVELIEINGTKVSLATKSAMPDPCHTYSRHTVQRMVEENTWRVIMHIKATQQYCISIIGLLEKNIELNVLEPGIHTIQFWKSDDETTDITVDVR